MMTERPTASEYAPFYADYVGRVPEDDILPVLERQVDEVRALFSGVSEERGAFRYAPEKWSVREVLGHLIDAERAFGFRAFCFARGDSAPLPGFDERAYVAAGGHGQWHARVGAGAGVHHGRACAASRRGAGEPV